MRKIAPFTLFLLMCSWPLPSQDAVERDIIGLGFSAGIGTDINLGIAVGGGVSYAFPLAGSTWLEPGIDVYYYSGTETSTDGPLNYTYIDTTSLLFYAVTCNTLFNYQPSGTGVFFIAGIGAGGASVTWKKDSPQDATYRDSGDETSGGLLINAGIGVTLGGILELKLRLPVFIVFRDYAGTLVSPMLAISAGLRF